MSQLKFLDYYTSLKVVLSEPYRAYLLQITTELSLGSFGALSKIYSYYIDTQGSDDSHVINYNAIEILNDSNELNNHLQNLVGFIYTELPFTEKANNRYV